MRLRITGLVSMAVVALTYGSMAWAQTPSVQPQLTVECTGWHALCSLATDCKVDRKGQNQADCACWKINENHMVVTAFIKNDTFGYDVKGLTQSTCTTETPCAVDEAPVCQAIKDLLAEEQWVSTYSYRGWCQNWDPVACVRRNIGPWADCMTSPCQEKPDPKDPDRPLSCQCTVNYGPFIGTNGQCKTKKGTVMSTIPRASWDFNNGTFIFPMPGYEYVKGACEPIGSD